MMFNSRDSDRGTAPPTSARGSGYLSQYNGPRILKSWDTFCVGLVLGAFLMASLAILVYIINNYLGVV